jgi:hypothetical protein
LGIGGDIFIFNPLNLDLDNRRSVLETTSSAYFFSGAASASDAKAVTDGLLNTRLLARLIFSSPSADLDVFYSVAESIANAVYLGTPCPSAVPAN